MSAADAALTVMLVTVPASKASTPNVELILPADRWLSRPATPGHGGERFRQNRGRERHGVPQDHDDHNILQISSGGRVSDPAPVPINASSLFTFDS
jgi:hypothetical protein